MSTTELELIDAIGSRRVTADFEESEWAALGRYVADAAQLCQCELVQREFSYKFTVKLKNGVQTVTGGNLPPDRDFEWFVFRLRKFMLDGEPVFFPHVRGTLGRRVNDEGFRTGLRFLKDQFLKMPFGVTVLVQGQNTALTSHESLMAWLNSELLHHDEDKAELFRRVFRLVPETASRSVFGMLLNEKSRAVINLANLIRVMLGHQEVFHLGSLAVRRI